MASWESEEPARNDLPEAAVAAVFAASEAARINAQSARLREANRALRDEIAAVLGHVLAPQSER